MARKSKSPVAKKSMKKDKGKLKRTASKGKSLFEYGSERKSSGGLGFEVKLDPQGRLPTEEDLRRFGPLSLEAKQAHTAIVLLDSEEDHVLVESLNSLQRFCAKRLENREIFVMLGGVDRIWKFFDHPHLIIQRLALKILAILSSLLRVKLLCRDYDFAEYLEKFIRQEDSVVLEYVSTIINAMATLFAGRVQIIQHSGMDFLLKMIKHSDPDIVKTTVETVLNLLQESLHDELLLKPEIISIFYSLIDSPYPPVQIIALSVLEKLTRRPDGAKMLLDTGIIENIVSRMDNPQYRDLHRLYLQIMLNLTQDVGNVQELPECLSELAAILDHSHDLQVLIRTVTLLGRMARIPSITKTLVTVYELVPKLVFIVSHYKDTDLRSAATYTAAQIALTDFKAKGQLADIFEAQKTFFFDPRANAAAFQNMLLATSIIVEGGEESGRRFLEADGISILKTVISSEPQNPKYSYHTIISALTSINTLSHYAPFRAVMAQQGILSGVLNQMKSYSATVVALAGTALTALLCQPEGRLEFLANNGPSYVAAALRNPELNVVVTMGPLISAIGSYPEIGWEMVNQGILTVLSDRPDLINRNGPLRVAMEKLITTHLPAKYAYTGHIGHFEKLPHDFYDIGVLSSDKVFTPLEKIPFDQRSQHQTVIYVNFDTTVDPKLVQENPFLATLPSSEVVSVYKIASEVRALMEENVRSEKDLVGLIATFVSAKFGGTLDKWRVTREAEELELADFQSKYQSVGVPLTCIKTGAHRPRALLFKALADIFGIPCSLDRGGFRKYWNVVLIRGKRKQFCCPCPEKPEDEQVMFYTERMRRFVVDLLYAPGTMFPLYSYEADTYCFS